MKQKFYVFSYQALEYRNLREERDNLASANEISGEKLRGVVIFKYIFIDILYIYIYIYIYILSVIFVSNENRDCCKKFRNQR